MQLLHAALERCACAVSTTAGRGFDHITIDDGFIYAYNGALYALEPAGETLGIQCAVPGALLQAAIAAAPPGVQVELKLSGNRLHLRAGPFTARLPATPPALTALAQPAPTLQLGASFANAISVCTPFLGKDVSRDWMSAILFIGKYAAATDGIAAVRVPLDIDFATTFLLPAIAAQELLKRDGDFRDKVVKFALDDQRAVFYFANGGILSSQLIAGQWPTAPEALFTGMPDHFDVIPTGLLSAVNAVTPFSVTPTAAKVTLHPRGAAIAEDAASASEEACVEGFTPGVLAGTYRADALAKVLAVATVATFNTAPRVHWRGLYGAEGLLAGSRG